MKNPLVDILLATYNGEKYLRVQLDSIFNQTYQNFQVIVSDDGSKDSTLEILIEYQSKFPNRLTILPFKGNQGINRNFSYLLENGQHDYFMFSDQDDFWLPEKIEITLAKMQESEKINGSEYPILVHSDLKVVDIELKIIHPSFWKYGKLTPRSASKLNRLLLQNNVTGCTIMVNQALRKLSLPVPQEAMMHDWWLAIVAAAFGKVEYIKDQTMLYRQHHHNANGATYFSIAEDVKNYFNYDPKKNQMTKNKNQAQTLAFKERYFEKLSTKQKKLVDAYLLFQEKTYWGKVPLALRYGFLKNGFFRNILSMIPKIKKIV
jgi:glycosyltransferase involved in cell wall biosynthesis